MHWLQDEPGASQLNLAWRFRVWGSGFRVQGLLFRVQGLGFRVQGSGLRVQSLGFRVQGLGFRVSGFWYVRHWRSIPSSLLSKCNCKYLSCSDIGILEQKYSCN